jgi:hypothetical protein
MKICPVGLSYSVWTDRWRDMTKLTVPFRNYVNTPKNLLWIRYGSGAASTHWDPQTSMLQVLQKICKTWPN